MTRYLTTAEAMELTRHAEPRNFLKWAKRHAPEILVRLPGRREVLVDAEKLTKFFERSEANRNAS